MSTPLRRAIVTGANSGLGLETARALADVGFEVVLAVRDPARGEAAAAQIPGRTEVRELDLADLASVRGFVTELPQEPDWEVALLVNNAGIMMVPEGRTADGFERQIGTNHLGHFALTNLLLPRITGRVVTVSSELHRGPQLDPDDLDSTRDYNPSRAYHRSKLANLLFTAELQRRLIEAGSSVLAVAAHPGYSATNLQANHPNPLARLGMWIGNHTIATSAAAGARPTVYAATADVTPAAYIGPTRFGGTRGAPGPVGRSTEAQDADVARRLWEVSEHRTGVSFPL